MATALIFGERRVHRRKECYFNVTVDDYKSAYTARIRNLSLGGALIEPPRDRNPRVGQELRITIPFRLKKDSVLVRGRIRRVRANGVGVIFQREEV